MSRTAHESAAELAARHREGAERHEAAKQSAASERARWVRELARRHREGAFRRGWRAE
jgi:hypothetical protein